VYSVFRNITENKRLL